jgi:RNA polymerase sigma-70 factor, ECF subfamily
VKPLEALTAPLRSFVVKRVPAGTDVDDVVQEVLVRVVERLPDLRDRERLDAWIFQIARNVLADSFRRAGRHVVLDDSAAAVADPGVAPETDRTAVAALTACLPPMIAKLPEPYRTAVELTELHGLTQHQAAQRAGISLSGMKSRVQRGREHLKRIMTSSCAIELDVRGGVTECEPRARGCESGVRPLLGSDDSMA